MPAAPSTIAIVFKRAELALRIGEHAWEKFAERPTRVSVDLELSFGYRDYFERNGGYVDYDPLRTWLKGLEQEPHVAKLETLAQCIARACFSLTPAARVRISLLKREIFLEMDGVGLSLDLAREDLT